MKYLFYILILYYGCTTDNKKGINTETEYHNCFYDKNLEAEITTFRDDKYLSYTDLYFFIENNELIITGLQDNSDTENANLIYIGSLFFKGVNKKLHFFKNSTLEKNDITTFINIECLEKQDFINGTTGYDGSVLERVYTIDENSKLKLKKESSFP